MSSDQSEALRGLLQPTMDYVAQQPAARKLCLALALAEGFTFQLAICNSPRVAAALQLWLEDAVGRERGEPIVLTRISPYPLDPSAAGPRSLGATELSQFVLDSLMEQAEVGDRLVFLDASWAKPRDAEAWRSLLLRLNEQRNTIARKLAAPFTMIIPPLLEVDLARLAPDLWSIRSVVVQIADRDVGVAATTLSQNFESSYRRAEDMAALEEEVRRVRIRAKRGDELAVRALRVLLLRLAGAKQRVGELDEAEQLIEEACSVADEEGLMACALARSDLLEVRGEWDEALRLVDSTIPVLRRLGDDWTLANAWSRRADILQARGELDEALRIHREEALPVYERLGDVRERAVTMGKIADVLQARGELDEALRIRREEQLPVYERLGDVHSRALTMGKIADVLQARGELDEALRIRREEQLPVYERLGDVRSRAVTMGQVADVLQARGELDEALRIRREEQLPVYERLGDARELLVGRAKLAATLARRGRSEDDPEIDRLLALALRDARRLRIPESRRIEEVIRSLGRDPDAPPFV